MNKETPLKVRAHDLKVLWFFFSRYRFRGAVVLASMIVAGMLEALNLAAVYPIITYGLELGDQDGLALRYLNHAVTLFGGRDLFLSACLFLMFITILATAAKIAFHILSNRLIRDIDIHTQQGIFQKYADAPYQYFINHQQGKLVYAGTVAPTGVSNNIHYAVRIANGAITTLFFVVLLLILAWKGMLAVAVLAVLYVAFVRNVVKRVVNRFSYLYVKEDENKNVLLNELITGIKTIKAYHAVSSWKQRYDRTVEASASYRYRVMVGRVLPDSFLKFAFFFSLAGIGILVRRYYAGNLLLLLPLLGTFVTVASRLIPYLNMLGSDFLALARFMPDARIIYDTLQEKVEPIRSGKKTLDAFRQEIRVSDVGFKYEGMDGDLLKGITLQIPKKQMTAIVGPSGSGKSTLVSMLLRLYAPQRGQILMDGVDIYDLDEANYNCFYGYVGQETFIFNGSIRDNIMFGRTVEESDVVHAARLANAHEFIEATENGYDTVVGDQGMKLSGGQRQRLAIARAMARRPQILVLDEATSSLDNVSERVVQDAINNVSKEITVLAIAHRLSTVQNADNIVVLENGEIVETGTHDELMKKKRVYFHQFTSSRN